MSGPRETSLTTMMPWTMIARDRNNQGQACVATVVDVPQWLWYINHNHCGCGTSTTTTVVVAVVNLPKWLWLLMLYHSGCGCI